MLKRPYLLLVCATVLVALACAQKRCDFAEIGSVTNDAYNLQERRVEPYMFTLEINVPNICPDTETAGLKVTACDVDQAPRVYLMDPMRGLVVREGNLETAAYVYITVYCVSGSEELSLESPDLPDLASRFLQQALQSSSSLPSLSPSTVQPSWDESTSTPVTPPPQQSSTPPPDPLLPSGVEAISILSTTSESKSEDSPVNLESRFSSVPEIMLSSLDQLIFPPIPLSLSPRLKDYAPFSLEQLKRPPISMQGDVSTLWKQRAPPSVGNLNRPFTLSSRWLENEPSSSYYKAKPPFTHQPSYDSYSPFENNFPYKRPSSSWTDTPLPSLAKRLSGWQPEQPPQWLPNRSPAWLKHPTKHPSSSWLKHGSLTDWSARKSLSRPRKGPTGRSFDDRDEWTLYEDDPLSLHWSEEWADLSPGWTEKQPLSHSVKDHSFRSKYSQSRHLNEELPNSLPHELPSPFSIKHITKNQQKYVPPLHEEDPALLAEWKDQFSKQSLLTKLFLLLQDHGSPKCGPGYAVDEGETWWPNHSLQQLHLDDGIPWQPDYPTDHSADDGDLWAPYLLSGNVDEIEQWRLKHLPSPEHLASAKEDFFLCLCCREWRDHPPITGSDLLQHWCPECPPIHSTQKHKQLRPPHSSSRYNKDTSSQIVSLQNVERLPLDNNPFVAYNPIRHYNPSTMTERPLLSSTVRNSLSWVKSSKSEIPAQLKQSISPKTEQPGNPQSAAPWSFLSKLLLSHPTFLDSIQ